LYFQSLADGTAAPKAQGLSKYSIARRTISQRASHAVKCCVPAEMTQEQNAKCDNQANRGSLKKDEIMWMLRSKSRRSSKSGKLWWAFAGHREQSVLATLSEVL
jgi:hypothetical protein